MDATKTTSARLELLAVNYLYPLPWDLNSYLDCKNPIIVTKFGEFLQFFDLTGAEESYAIRINEVINSTNFRVSAHSTTT
jgi:hypothetical protein